MKSSPPNRHIPARTRLLGCGVLIALSALSSRVSAQTTPTPATTETDEVVTLSTFNVSTEKDIGYRATNSIAATRSNTPIKDVPLNIQVFTKDLYDDLAITNQVDLERYNASLINGGADAHSDNPIQQAYNAFLFRGFVQNWGLRDGIREYDPIDTQGLSRVEVIKGPAAALYGLAYPGGVMNNITKDVDYTKNFGAISVMLQSEGEYRAAVDANFTASGTGGKFGIRFNAANTETKDERAHSAGSIRYTQVSLNWRPIPSTELKFLAERGYREKPNGLSYFSRGETDAQGNSLGNGTDIPLQITHPEIPWTWNWADGRNMRSLDTKLYRGSATQTFGDQFSVTGYIQFSERQQIDGNGWDANGSGGGDSWETGSTGWLAAKDSPTGKETIASGYSYRDWSNTMHSYGATGVYKFNFDQVKNTFTFGANVWSEKFVSRSSTTANPYDQATQATLFAQYEASNPQVYIFRDVKAGIDTASIPFGPPPRLHPVTTGNGYTHEDNSNDYYFASWQLSTFENRLKFNASVNKTNLKLVQWANGSASAYNLTEQSKTSPMIGGMYDITKEASFFLVHATSLFPTTDKNSFGTQMPPVVGSSIEGGFKFELAEGKVSGTVSYYKIKQTGGDQNNPTAENLNTQRWDGMTSAQRAVAFPGKTRADLLGDLVPGAESESKGFEADVIYQPTRNWQVLFSFGHNKQAITKSLSASTIGQSSVGHIGTQFSVLTKYMFTEGEVKGLSVGLGLQSSGKALQGYQGSLARYNPSTVYAEVFGAYRFKFLGRDSHVQLNVKNLTKQAEFFGWKATGSASKIATERYEVPTAIRYGLTFGMDL